MPSSDATDMVNSNISETADNAPNIREMASWRRNLLPLMSLMLIISAIFFGVTAVREYDRAMSMFSRLEGISSDSGNLTSSTPVSVQFADRLFPRTTKLAPSTFDEQIKLDTLRATVALEHQTITLRYGQAAQNIAGRLWTRLMGFVTGMILSVVGASFVLGRLEDRGATASFEAQGWKAAISSSSPGIILAMLGTFLMVVSAWVTINNETTDGAVYFGVTSESAPNEVAPVPTLDQLSAKDRAAPAARRN